VAIEKDIFSDWTEISTDQDAVPIGFKGEQVDDTTTLYYTLIEP
jgi:hypothetical protein